MSLDLTTQVLTRVANWHISLPVLDKTDIFERGLAFQINPWQKVKNGQNVGKKLLSNKEGRILPGISWKCTLNKCLQNKEIQSEELVWCHHQETSCTHWALSVNSTSGIRIELLVGHHRWTPRPEPSEYFSLGAINGLLVWNHRN